MSLKAQLDACRRAFEASTAPSVVSALQGSIAELARTGLVRRAVKAGEMASLFRLRSDNGDLVSLSAVLDRGPAIVSFFRGAWCPFCRLELQALAQAQSETQRLGATLVVLSPLPGGDRSSGFPVLRDPGCRVAARYRIAFTVAPRFRPAYFALGYPERLKRDSDGWALPLPATYVIDATGLVVLSYVDADYTTRLDPAEIVAALAHLRARANRSRPLWQAVEHSGRE
jgi:peroxiredoxin